MKTFTQSFVAALLLSTATFASIAPTHPTKSANPTITTSSFKAAVFPSSVTPAKLKVILEREPGKVMGVYLRDSRNNLLAIQRIEKKTGSCHFTFDLGALEDGEYNVQVVCGSDVTVHPVTLTTQKTSTPSRIIALN